MLSKLSLSLAAAIALSAAAGGVARANPILTSSDEARAFAAQVTASRPAEAALPGNGAITSTDEARVLAGHSLPASSSVRAGESMPMIVTSTDEARARAEELAN